jgi:hypothetical protein
MMVPKSTTVAPVMGIVCADDFAYALVTIMKERKREGELS